MLWLGRKWVDEDGAVVVEDCKAVGLGIVTGRGLVVGCYDLEFP